VWLLFTGNPDKRGSLGFSFTPMKKYILAAVMMAVCCSSRLAADYVIWTDYQTAGKTLQVGNASNSSNHFEVWRWTDTYGPELIVRWEVYIDYGSSSPGVYYFNYSLTNYFSSVTCSGDGYNLTLSNLPEGYYFFSVGEGGGYPTTNWHGLWDGSSGSLGWHAASQHGAFSFSQFGYNYAIRDVSMFNIQLY
jgi:hypothetical protein